MGLLQDIGELLRTLRHRKPSKIYCPKCGSHQIYVSSSFDSWLTPRKYVCRECGYLGPVVMELEEEKTQDSAT